MTFSGSTSHPHSNSAHGSPVGSSATYRDDSSEVDSVEYRAALQAEQAYVDMLFDRLDAEVAASHERLAQVQADVDPANPDADALVRRETEYHLLHKRLDRLGLAQIGLVFGRIDIDAPGDNPTATGLDRRYIGRMGLDAREDNYRTLLLDWRAPMARPFYLATTAQPEGVAFRRHIRSLGRTVTAIHDEVLSQKGREISASTRHRADVTSESALFEALERARTEHMSSIVETIQREQDEIIRDSRRGVMVVEGGPGTGKTAVALHRVAYLLYNHRDQLARSAVLIVGPNSEFLEYISQVLPELGETGVVLSTVGELYPDVKPGYQENMLTREVKGSEAMVDILRAAVRSYQVIPTNPGSLRIGSLQLVISPADVKTARTRARRTRKPHNEARAMFIETFVEALAAQMAQKIGADPLGGENLLSRADVDQLFDDLLDEDNVKDLLDELWPTLTPQRVLSELLSSHEAIEVAAAGYDEETQHALYREDGNSWSTSDTALLDELAVLIGMPDLEQEEEEAHAAWKAQVAEAEDALDILSSSDSTDNDDDLFEAEILSAHDVVDAETLARRQEVRDTRTTAQRARADYTWAYGHVVIDEAQELSPMEWRMIFRRSPSRWMTVVGDTAQTSAPAGVDDWDETLAPFVGNRIHKHTLSVNYRTPQPIADVAHQLRAAINPDASPPVSVRSGTPVRFIADIDPQLEPGVRTDKEGRLCAVITAENVEEFKGLEFDHVSVVDPQAIVESSDLGANNLYVALSRATQTLTIYGPYPEWIPWQ